MNPRRAAITTTIIAALIALLALDWYVIGVGPLPQWAIHRCANQEEVLAAIFARAETRRATRADCREAWRNGDLNLRGAIND